MPENFENYPGQMPPNQFNQQPMTQVNIGGLVFYATPEDASGILKARRNSMIAGALAIISLFIGGVLLDIVALILAVTSYNALKRYGAKFTQESMIPSVLQRTGRTPLIIAFIASVLNLVSLILFYPIVSQFVENNDIDGLMQYLQTGQMPSYGTSPGSGGSVW